MEMRNPALDAWGDYDRDDPYPLFAQVQADGPVHEVTLADGHLAWLIVGHDDARAALNHAALSRTCTPRWPVMGRSSPRACPVPPSPGTCSALTRPTMPGCAGWPRVHSAGDGWRPFGHVSSKSSTA